MRAHIRTRSLEALPSLRKSQPHLPSSAYHPPSRIIRFIPYCAASSARRTRCGGMNTMWNKKARARFPEAAAGCSRGVFPSRRAARPDCVAPRRKFPPRTAMGRQECKRNREYIVRNFIYCFMRGCFRYCRGVPRRIFHCLSDFRRSMWRAISRRSFVYSSGFGRSIGAFLPPAFGMNAIFFMRSSASRAALSPFWFCELFQQDKVFCSLRPRRGGSPF